jgi:hypothetical protein
MRFMVKVSFIDCFMVLPKSGKTLSPILVTIMIILALILLSLSSPVSSMVELPVLSPGNYPAYQDYLSLYDKRYPLEEIPEREALYNQRVGSIREHNEKEGMEYLQTVNNFTDWTYAELNSRHH